MKRNRKNYYTLFKSTFFLSAFTFGGGYVIIPLMKKTFVDKLNWMGESEMLNIAAMAQSSPGAMAVNASILIGWRLMGISGALTAILGTVLPPIIFLSVISMFYTAFRDNNIVSAILKGMMAGVCAVIFDVVITMSGQIIMARKLLPIFILSGSFVMNFVFNVNVIYIIIFCGTLGALVNLYDEKMNMENM